MQKLLSTLFAVLLFPNLFAQLQTGDTILVKGNPIGVFKGSTPAGDGSTGHYFIMHLELNRDVTREEWRVLNSILQNENRGEGLPKNSVSVIYNYSSDSKEQKSGRLLYDAGLLKNRSTHLRLAAIGVGLTTSLVSSILLQKSSARHNQEVLNNSQLFSSGQISQEVLSNRNNFAAENLERRNNFSRLFLTVGVSVSFSLSTLSLVSDYKSNRKIQDAGALLQMQ